VRENARGLGTFGFSWKYRDFPCLCCLFLDKPLANHLDSLGILRPKSAISMCYERIESQKYFWRLKLFNNRDLPKSAANRATTEIRSLSTVMREF
jgi:hypothetical protein